MRRQAQLTNQQVKAFLSRHRLPAKFRSLIDKHYAPLASWLTLRRAESAALIVGIGGAQGTGKSTLAKFLKLALEATSGWRVAVLSLDDFYSTKIEREHLGESVHRLLETRGVPGTHDLKMLSACIDDLRLLGENVKMRTPRFDKAQDDRMAPQAWPVISGPVDAIILEGWCVGSTPQPDGALAVPVNSLEKEQDQSAEWRRFVNSKLAGEYAALFRKIDALVYLRAPNFDAVYRWRLEQEKKLAAASGDKSVSVMNDSQVARFVQHFERITRANLATLPDTADVVLDLDDHHDCVRSRYAESLQ